ncbi:hypothetical protein [Nocardia farcinica]|uniref:hypothetical protein n=1 Tax=Nocardia farcinica TaxID=37329 RepID=UPI00189324B6|nr:hypothetical protein [Nocardia farcinica]MBF6143208.1 hypothetical protein [Nocardia farcinica]MBF6387838.1 hypothetical protein [Nocardia farcinica]MBF6539425.1 hypothetical protein [Nocardia farcinica]
MEIDDAGRLDGLLRRGAVSVAEADSLRLAPVPERDLADTLLLRLCMQPTNEAAENLFLPDFGPYADLVKREPEALGRLAEPVARVLGAAADGYAGDNADERSVAVLRALGGPGSNPRRWALALEARVFAHRIRDGVTRPIVGALGLAAVDIDAGAPRTAEVLAVEQVRRLSERWIADRAGRAWTDAEIVRVARMVTWPEAEVNDVCGG